LILLSNILKTTNAIKQWNINLGNIEVIDLLGYKNFVKMQQDSLFIISDSGTAQEEPALLNIPVIVPRDFTERPESMQYNCSYMLKMNADSYEMSKTWLKEKPASEIEWLGDGKTAETTVSILKKVL